MTELKVKQSPSAEERKMLEDKLDKESRARVDIEAQRAALQEKLQDMEAQMMVGGEIANKVAKQEAELRRA